MLAQKILKPFLFVCLVFLSQMTMAQDMKKVNNALKFLKVGNTLREAQQYELAEKYITQSLLLLRAANDKYWEAAAYEQLGLLYKDQDKNTDALRYFNQSLDIYREIKASLSERALAQMIEGMHGKEEIYAGIDIGAKGIKLSIISVKLNKGNEFEYLLMVDSSINTEPVSLTDQSRKETADALKVLLGLAKNQYKISNDRTYVVVSSGLKQELDKYNKLDEFVKAIDPSAVFAGVHMQYVSPKEEGELSVLGIVPAKRRYSTSLLDVGSGNTKGGYFIDASQIFEPFNMPYGTKTFVKLVKSKNPTSNIEFARVAERMMRDSLGKMIRDEVGRKSGLKNRGFVYLSGGIVWAIASYMYPEKVNDNYMELSAYDVRKFKDMVIYHYDELTHPNLNRINDFVVLEDAKKNLSHLQNTFDQESLTAGAVWLDALVNELNTALPIKRFIFPKYSYVGWISGYMVREVTKDYNKRNEQGGN
jgi:hypothetical protein